MTPEWIPLLLIAGFLGFRFLVHASYPLCILLHELGHAVPARLCGKTEVEVHLGTGADLGTFRFAGMCFQLHREQTHTGTTRYQGGVSSVTQATLIILTAPMLSLALTLASGWWLLSESVQYGLPVVFSISAMWLANLHITFSAWWPIGNPQSDWNDFLQTVRALKPNPSVTS